MYIIEQFIIEKKNASLIRKAIKNKYNEANLNIRAIYKFMKTIRQCIAEYLNNIYEEEDISTQYNNNYFAVDESLFTTIDNSPQWVVGIISTTDRTKFRCNITTTRNANYLRNFIACYIQRGNTIISDGWNGYMWLNNEILGIIIFHLYMVKVIGVTETLPPLI